MELKISKMQDKVEALDVKGQGCLDDCPTGYWSGYVTPFMSGCVWVVTTPGAFVTSWW